MLSPIKSLFASQRIGQGGAAVTLPSLVSSPGATSLLQPGAPAKLGAQPTAASLFPVVVKPMMKVWHACRGH